ncbi:hypothetical protein LTR99_001401 [Exophiala xenobiotica]|uniref:Major facilitator superfamily (MFS) profile domain-containing protein n=1 Tax=Vermiconidia calcicola TaxID=1690605 RepID=A0AAV9QQY4_9PEZI|nr:hypothetical protein LTR96_003268 [Exophiala xenobiotica]KAK5545965.1 hypothetical protein LTR25_000975 [Vermiconidia calcicola]KAK5549778.1 hypothetical protein LTR23_000069 [Chaetothyriales sp. CCFEE 6169]KAK5308426.1 hypothetical protein LTR99_001401 [Exophiala xenobiotica]KAK5342679.1 hypothetical protein LTR98_000305 [Exophiala xenobiotica]
MGLEPWRLLPGKWLMIVLNIFTAIALIFEGYNQGVLGSVSNTPAFIDMAKIGADGVVTNTTKQGGLVAAYYFGALFGCFFGGYAGDKTGRKMGTLVGSLFCVAGSALQAGSVNANMFLCARVISGIGIGFTSTIIPPWIAELSQAHARGATFSYVFIANFVGITIAVWLNFGIRNTELQFRWRFPLGIMVLPMLVVAGVVLLLPESPRWLMSQGRREESIEILRRIRGDVSEDDPELLAEVEQLQAVVEASHHKRNDFINLIRGRYSGKLHLGRRVVLSLALQQISSWTGIIAIVTWSGELFRLSGFSPYKSSWLGGLVNTTGIFGTAAAALVIDRLGRKMSWLVSLIIQAISLFLVAGLIKASQDRVLTDPDTSRQLGTAAACFVFIFLWFFTMFGIIPVWVYGTEIWPLEVRAKGYAFTVLGWAIGCGMTTLTIPIMLSKLGWNTFIFFGVMNLVCMPLVWFFYVETAGCSLEEINLLFAHDSILASKNMAEYKRRVAEAGGNKAVAARRLLDEVDGLTELDPARVIPLEVATDNKTEKREVDVVEY